MSEPKDLEDLVAQAKAGRLKPLVLVHGDQDFLVKQAYDRLREAWVPEGLRDFNLEQHDGARADPQALLDSLAIPPMLPGPKAVGVYDARFFAGKVNAAEMLDKARERWAAGQQGPALRELGRLLGLASLDWEAAAQGGAGLLAEALDLGEAPALKEPWLAQALAQGSAQGLPAGAGDDSGVLAEGLEALLDRWVEGTVLVCACTSADQRKRLTKLFIERGQVLSFKRADKPAQAVSNARPYLRLELDKRGLRTSQAFNERLLAAYGAELGQLEKELDKLQAHAWPRTDLTDADLAAVGSPRPEEDVFKLVDAFAKKDLAGAVRLLRELGTADKDAPFRILNLVIVELRLMVLLRALIDEGALPSRGLSDATAFRMQVHPKLAAELPPALGAWWRKTNAWRLFYALKRAAGFRTGALHGILQALAEGEVACKRGQREPLELLQGICVRACGGREEVLL